MMDYSLAIERNEVLIYSTTWMCLVSEIIQTQKEKNCVIPLMLNNLNRQIIEIESKLDVIEGWRQG